MAGLLENMLVRKVPFHSTMTEMNHLGRAFVAKPEKMASYFDQLFTSSYYSDNPLTTMLLGEQRVKEIEVGTTEWEYDIRGASQRPVVVVENMHDSSIKIGYANSTILLKADEKYFVAGDHLSPGNPDIQVRVEKDPVRHGDGYIYYCVNAKSGFTESISQDYFKPGTRWNKLFSTYEEGSEQSGSTMYSFPITLKNRMSRVRKMYKITGDVATEALAVQLTGQGGKKYNTWVKYAEAEYWQQWYRELENLYWYAIKSEHMEGSTGRKVYTGPGVHQQIMDNGHKHYYSTLTAKLFQEFTMDIFFARKRPGKRGIVRVGTGEIGMMLLSEALQNDAKNTGFTLLTGDQFVRQTNSPYHKNALVYGSQFVAYQMANGAELQVFHVPGYDDPTINSEIDPVTGWPKGSMRYTFLDVGDMMDSNIKLVSKRGGYTMNYIEGLASPYGNVAAHDSKHAGDYYEMHCKKQTGIHIEDPTRTGMLILNR